MWDIPAMVKWIAIAAIALAIGYLGWSYKSTIEKASVLEQQNAQLQQVVNDTKKQLADEEAINATQLATIDEIKAKNDELNQKLEGLDEYLNSNKAHDDSIKEYVETNKDGTKTIHKIGPGASEVLKRTIRELSRQTR